ncbi:MAG: hypothetical protein AAB131_06645 [Actinomycetota bacterium]|jgi:hypothetical protein|nr:MAG: hypothetical protein FD127_3369 [Acidimicrobiaceae bacterium]
MLLYSRVVTAQGSPRRILAYALEATAYVNANSPLEVTCWSGGFGYPGGTVIIGAFVESQAALASALGGLIAQDGFNAMIEAGPVSSRSDMLREVVHGQPSGPPPIGAVATVTTAAAVIDRLADATVWAVEIAQHVESVTGSPVAVLADVYGQMGTLTWIGTGDDAAAADDARAKLRANASYVAKLEGSRGLFVPGTGHVASLTRIG